MNALKRKESSNINPKHSDSKLYLSLSRVFQDDGFQKESNNSGSVFKYDGSDPQMEYHEEIKVEDEVKSVSVKIPGSTSKDEKDEESSKINVYNRGRMSRLKLKMNSNRLLLKSSGLPVWMKKTRNQAKQCSQSGQNVQTVVKKLRRTMVQINS